MRIEISALRILFALSVIQREESKAAKCYQCNSEKDKDCALNRVDEKYFKPCPFSQPFCRKAVYIYYFTKSREYRIIRECAKLRNTEKECYRGRYARDTYQLVCECKGAGCNRSTRSSRDQRSHVFLYILCLIIVTLVRNPT